MMMTISSIEDLAVEAVELSKVNLCCQSAFRVVPTCNVNVMTTKDSVDQRFGTCMKNIKEDSRTPS